MTRRAAPRRFTIPELRQRCRQLRELCRAPDNPLATEEEVAAVFPGGADNAMRGLDGWIECYAGISALVSRQDHRDASRRDTSERLEAVVRAAAARQPVPVLLSIGDRNVYPKSMWALAFLDAIDAIVAPMAGLANELAIAGEQGNDDIRGMPRITEGLAWRTWAWILLSEGVGLPFADEGEIDPPEWTGALLPEDYVTIWMAHRQLHADASAIMASAMPRESGERSRLSLGGFLAGYASEHGLAPSHIMRRWSLGEAIAAATSAAESHRVAEANAKRKSREGGA